MTWAVMTRMGPVGPEGTRDVGAALIPAARLVTVRAPDGPSAAIMAGAGKDAAAAVPREDDWLAAVAPVKRLSEIEEALPGAAPVPLDLVMRAGAPEEMTGAGVPAILVAPAGEGKVVVTAFDRKGTPMRSWTSSTGETDFLRHLHAHAEKAGMEDVPGVAWIAPGCDGLPLDAAGLDRREMPVHPVDAGLERLAGIRYLAPSEAARERARLKRRKNLSRIGVLILATLAAALVWGWMAMEVERVRSLHRAATGELAACRARIAALEETTVRPRLLRLAPRPAEPVAALAAALPPGWAVTGLEARAGGRIKARVAPSDRMDAGGAQMIPLLAARLGWRAENKGNWFELSKR